MKIYILFISIMLTTLSAWEINTHRAFDQEALRDVLNLSNFVANAQVEHENYKNERFEGYDTTYFKYVTEGETNGISSKKWTQTFALYDFRDLIEAGVILEDAQWPDAWFAGNGRFNNHFYDAQDNGNELTIGWKVVDNALDWAKGATSAYSGVNPFERWNGNKYDYTDAGAYLLKGFTEEIAEDRRAYLARAFVSVGHVMHMMNDMSSTAHTRNDSHPEGDPMEVWGRGGEDANLPMGLRVGGVGAYGVGKYKADDSVPKYATFDDFIKKEAEYTSTHFFSSDTIFKSGYFPREEDTYESAYIEIEDGIKRSYIRSKEDGRKLAVRLKSHAISVIDAIFPGDQRITYLGDTRIFGSDYTVLEENAAILIPRAISNARNFVNYFFRGSMAVEANPCGVTVTNDSNANLVASPDVVIFKKGGIVI